MRCSTEHAAGVRAPWSRHARARRAFPGDARPEPSVLERSGGPLGPAGGIRRRRHVMQDALDKGPVGLASSEVRGPVTDLGSCTTQTAVKPRVKKRPAAAALAAALIAAKAAVHRRPCLARGWRRAVSRRGSGAHRAARETTLAEWVTVHGSAHVRGLRERGRRGRILGAGRGWAGGSKRRARNRAGRGGAAAPAGSLARPCPVRPVSPCQAVGAAAPWGP